MSHKSNREDDHDERDLRMPKYQESEEAQREKAIRNTDKHYDAESPIDPFEDPPEKIVDRAEEPRREDNSPKKDSEVD